jgi:hypothetical protein
MANLNAPFGLRPMRRVDGLPWAGAIQKRPIQNGFATSLFRGDLVTWNTSGYLTRYANGGAIADAVFMGCNYLDAVSGRRVWSPFYPGAVVATGDIEGDFMMDSDVLCELQTDNTVPTIAIIGGNIDITATAGSTANGQSAEVGVLGGVAVTATLPLRIESFSTEPDNDPTAAFARVMVTLNTQGRRTNTGI